jgi:hypothetical protein
MVNVRLVLLLGLLSAVRAAGAADYQFHIPQDITDGFLDTNANAIAALFEESQNTTIRMPFALEANEAVPIEGYARIAEINVEGGSWTVSLKQIAIEFESLLTSYRFMKISEVAMAISFFSPAVVPREFYLEPPSHLTLLRMPSILDMLA